MLLSVVPALGLAPASGRERQRQAVAVTTEALGDALERVRPAFEAGARTAA